MRKELAFNSDMLALNRQTPLWISRSKALDIAGNVVP
jgi:hypothetical protein